MDSTQGSTLSPSLVEKMAYQPLVPMLGTMVVGILIDRHVPFSVVLWWGVAMVAWGLWLVTWRWRRHWLALAFLLVCTAALGAMGHHWHWNLFDECEIGAYVSESPQPVCFEAEVEAGPRPVPAQPPDPLRPIVLEEQSRLQLSATRIRQGNTWKKVTGKIQMYVEGSLLDINVGDRIRIFAKMLKPRAAKNPGEFDLYLHQRADRILCRAYANHSECVQKIESGFWWNPQRWLERLRSSSNELLWTHLSKRRGGLASAVLLGSREQLDPDRVEAFFVTGTIHLFAISGLHVGILAMGLLVVARIGVVRRNYAIVAVVIVTVLYALLTDARPPVVRATILVSAYCFGMILGRRGLSINSLAMAGIIILIWNPADLFRTGVQLSFLAVAVLAYVGPMIVRTSEQDPLKKLIQDSRPWWNRTLRRFGGSVSKLVLASMAVWLISLPLVAYRFHLVTPLAVFLNTVLWIPMTVSLYCGFATIVLGSVIPFLGVFFGAACDLNLGFLEWCVQMVRVTPGSHYWVAGPPLWWVVGFYVGLLITVGFPSLWSSRLRVPGFAVFWILVGLGSIGATSFGSDEYPLDCTFLAVGHGTSVVLEMPDGQTILYDAGTLGPPLAGIRSVSSFLWSRGIHHLDAVVLSHADIDHYNALPGLVERFSVGTVYASPGMFVNGGEAVERLEEAILQARIPRQTITVEQEIPTGGGATIRVLHPGMEVDQVSDNSNSVVLLVEYAGQRVLLPGDLESDGLEQLLATPPQTAAVVMAPHHGSSRSRPSEFAAWCQPQWVVVSSGHGHDSSVVRAVFEEAGARVCTTSESGAVRFTFDRSGILVRQWRVEGW